MQAVFISSDESKVLALAVDLYLNDLDMREDKLFERQSVFPLDASELLYLKQIMEKKAVLTAIQAKLEKHAKAAR